MKLALYADVNLNLIDGSAIWLTSVVQILASVHDNKIDLFLKSPIENGVNIDPLFQIPNLRIVPPALAPKQKYLMPADALSVLTAADLTERYDAIFLRGLELCHQASAITRLHGRLWVYFTDLPVNAAEIDAQTRERIDRVIDAARYVFVQTPQFRAHLEATFPQAAPKARSLPPMVPAPPRRPLSQRQTRPLRIVYSGQFKPDYASLEMFRIFRSVLSEFPDVELHVYGEKIHNPPDDPAFRGAVQQELATCPNLVWHKGRSRDEVLAAFDDMDLGWAWRNDRLEGRTLEISTKLLEFSSYGVPPVMARNQVNESVFGADYPLFANSEDEALEKLRMVLRSPGILEAQHRRVRELVRPFQFDYVSKHCLEPLCRPATAALPRRKPRLTLVGHDFKFIEPLARIFALHTEMERDCWWGHKLHDAKASEEMLARSDVIFCEWFLGNVVWYSQRKRPDQKLIVRFHRQELETPFPAEADLDRIDHVIVVSDHTRRDAIAKFGWERHAHKVIVLPNAIDCAYFRRVKVKGSAFHIGMVGILPKLKRFDLALDVLEKCKVKDPRCKLFIKGRRPTELAWLRDRPDEMAYYTVQMNRIEHDPALKDSVIFDGWGGNMGEWYRQVGFILSTSDLEDTHQAVAEGGAAGALPIMRAWDGADEVYSADWICTDTSAMAQRILDYGKRTQALADDAAHTQAFMASRFDLHTVSPKYISLMLDSNSSFRA